MLLENKLRKSKPYSKTTLKKNAKYMKCLFECFIEENREFWGLWSSRERNAWLQVLCSPLFQTWGHLPIVSEGQHSMNRKPWSHWDKKQRYEIQNFQRDENEGEKTAEK